MTSEVEVHESPIKTPGQLIKVVFLAFVVPIFAIVLLVNYVVGAKGGGAGTASFTPEAVAARLKPVATVAYAAEGGAAGHTLRSGEAVVQAICGVCHGAGVAGAPKIGDAAAWGPRNAQGLETLLKHATEGYKGMPAKGGSPDIDPTELARAVVYMADKAGAKFKEPDAPAK